MVVKVNFATPIAHQPNADYSVFDKALTVGRDFRQPLQTAPDPDKYVSGLELFLSSAGDVAAIFSWFDAALTWQPSSATALGNRLVLTLDPRVLYGSSSLAGLVMIEAKPLLTIYENVDQAAVQSALETLLNTAYQEAGSDHNSWKPAMRMQVWDGTQYRDLKIYLDNLPAPQTPALEIHQLIQDFLAGADSAKLSFIQVQAGDTIGRAAPYLATDPLPTSPLFPLGAPADPNRARRLTFRTIDPCSQSINPIYYLYVFMQQALLPQARQIVNSLTNIVASGTLTHPLVTLYPSLANKDAIPRAREQLSEVSRFPMGDLAQFHGYPANQPVSSYEWHYSDSDVFEARTRANQAPVSMSPSAIQTTRVTNLWTAGAPNAVGNAIAGISDYLQIPCEAIIGLIGAESQGDPNDSNSFDQRPVRFEPLRDSHSHDDRHTLDAAGIPAADVLQYDKVVGVEGTVTNVVSNTDGTSLLDITLNEGRKWSNNFLVKNKIRVLVGDTDRLAVTANNGSSTSVTNYQISVRDFQFKGGFAPSGSSAGTQGAGSTLFYSPSARGTGNATEAPVLYTLQRAGTMRMLQVKATANTLDGPTTITVFHNGAPSGITITLAAKAKSGNDITHTFPVAANDTISIQIATAGTTGTITNLTWTLLNAPASGDAWVLEGYSLSLPDPTTNPVNNSDIVRAGRTLTWGQMVAIVNETKGERVSPGIIQTLISTAREALPWLTALQPDIFTTLHIPTPPATPGEFLTNWLLHPAHSILVGAAYIRQGYNDQETSFDLPVIGSAYNHGLPQQDGTSPWGLNYYGTYVERAGPHFNAATTLFNTTPNLLPAPTVSFMR